MLFSILLAGMVLLGVVITALILLQQGKGADAGAAFGSGASGTVFGSRGSGGFMGRTTGGLMALFMVLAVVMAWVTQHGGVQSSSVMVRTGKVPAAITRSLAAPAVRTTTAPASTPGNSSGTRSTPKQAGGKPESGKVR